MEKIFKYVSLNKTLILLITIGIFLLSYLFVLNIPKKTHNIAINKGIKGEAASGKLSPTPAPQEHTVIPTNIIIATGVYNYLGAKTSISIQFPESGGRVAGNATDECNGSVTGVYDGKESINGNATGTCKIFNNNLPSQASYGGIVQKDQKKIVVNFQGTSESYSHKGAVTLYFK